MSSSAPSPGYRLDMHQVLMNIPAMIAILKGPDHRYELANPIYMKVIGEERQVIGRPVREALPELEGQGIYELLDNVYETGVAYVNSELKVQLSVNGDLKDFYFRFVYQPIKSLAGNVEGIFVHATDITEYVIARKKLKESEERFKSFVMNSPVPTAIYVGKEMRITTANEALLKTWDKPEEKVIGKTFREALPELEGQPFFKLLDDVYTTGVPYQAMEDKVELFRNGKMETTYYNFTYKALRNELDEIYGVINTGVEVTELVEAKNEIKKAEEKLEEQVRVRTIELEKLNNDLVFTNEQLKQFAYVASHDLQEPLRKINMFCDKLMNSKEEVLSSSGRKYFEKIVGAARRMSALINDLLNFTRLDAQENSFANVDLNDVADKVKEDYEILISQKSALVNIGKLCMIEAVPLQMNQLVFNLMGNALKFSREGVAPVVNIYSKILSAEDVAGFPNLDSSAEYCEIIFSDNGIGFDQQFSEKIFEIFQRLHGKSQYEGTGIGLALCKKIVDFHKGEIYAMSQEGEGASFHIILPVKRQ